MKKLFPFILPLLFLLSCKENTKQEQTEHRDTIKIVSDQDIVDAYTYLLGRDIVLKQQRIDFEKEGFKWNELLHRAPGGVAWANPNLDVVYSEAWIAVDENTCVLLEIPEIRNRYYTWHMLNGWGETILNINERTFPQQPYGKYALCLKGSNPQIPAGALRVDIPCKTARVLARVELGKNRNEAIALQKQFKLTVQGQPQIDTVMQVPIWEGIQLPGAELFDNASAMLATEADINEGLTALPSKVTAVEALVKSGSTGKAHVDSVIHMQAIPTLLKKIQNLGISQNGWMRPEVVGNYGNDYQMRTIVNIIGIWANNNSEATYFGCSGADGSATYTMTFPKDALPKDNSTYFWSVIAVDGIKYQVLPNTLKRYLLNKQSDLKYNADGSLTLVFGPQPIKKYAQSNWLPTIAGEKYNLTFRFYGPSEGVINGTYFPPALVKE